MTEWEPITAAELQALLDGEVERCSPTLRAFFSTYRVDPYAVPFRRVGGLEYVWVVAELPAGRLYYEDVEEGFEVGRPDANGVLDDNGCNQLELHHALTRWAASG